MLAIATYATESYFYCWEAFLRRITAAAQHHDEAYFILATDTSKTAKDAFEVAKRELPEGWRLSFVPLPIVDHGKAPKDYKENTQLKIAALQSAAFSLARKTRTTGLWSVEADVLVPADALRVSEWTLQMPQADGSPYYDVAAVTYPNGLFLGGFGSYQRQIADDFTEEERIIPQRLQKALQSCKKRLEEVPTNTKEAMRLGRLSERIKKCPPQGNIWEITAKHGWKRRGWMDFAYPAIGLGSIVPSDWCGLGCTLMSGKALSLATFEGYAGRGTQDLFLCWNRWHPANIKIACIPHTVASHVKRTPEGDIEHMIAYHEPIGEFRGHLRQRKEPWIISDYKELNEKSF